MRALGSPLQLWDVRNVEAHVARAVEAGLDIRSARLSSAQYDRCFQFCLQKCWEMSGLQADGKTPRMVYLVVGALRPEGAYAEYRKFTIGPYTTQTAAELALGEQRAGKPVAFAMIEQVRPKGAYDKSNGLLFSTYSYRAIVNWRIDDWYRSDPEFGDTRYESNRREELSLEDLATRHHDDGDDASADGAFAFVPVDRLAVIDSLNPYAYQDAGEEVLTREAFGFGG